MFNKQLAEKACNFFPKYLQHTKGRWAGKKFELLPWQTDLVGKLFGTVNSDSYRQYTFVYIFLLQIKGGIFWFLSYRTIAYKRFEITSGFSDRD